MCAERAPSFGTLLRSYRRTAQLTQEELAEKAGLSARSISDFERDLGHRPRTDTLDLLESALELPPEAANLLRRAARRIGARVERAPPGQDHAAQPVGGYLGATPAHALVSRDEEVGLIGAAVETVAEGTGAFLVLSGQLGIGKTRLAQEAALLARLSGFSIAVGRCYEPESTVPFFPFLELMAMAYLTAPAAVRTQIPSRWPQLAYLLPGELGATPDEISLLPGESQQPLFRSVGAFLKALADEGPLALFLDDLHWADPASLRLLAHVARETRASRVLMLATCLDAPRSRDHPLEVALRELGRERLVQRVPLRRLPPDGTTAMVAALVDHVAMSDEFTDFIHRRTRGVPAYIAEVLESLVGRYRLEREIGSGGMGRVFQAVDTRTEERVAAKIMFTSREPGDEAALRFQQEGAVLATLDHPNIVRVHGTFMEERASCIIMELLDGRSLGQIVRDEPLDLARTKTIGLQTAAALDAAHRRGIVHRDVKPDNIMVLPGDEVKVTDFGIARVLRPEVTVETLTSTGLTLGTPLYMSPEQIEGKRVDGRADIYSLGAVIYQMLTGSPPFEATDPLTLAMQHLREDPRPPRKLQPWIPPDWEVLVLRCLAKDPADRFATADALRAAIAALEVDAPGQVASDTTRPTRGRTPTPARALLRVLTPGSYRDDEPAANPRTPQPLADPSVRRQATSGFSLTSLIALRWAALALAAVIVAFAIVRYAILPQGASFRVLATGTGANRLRGPAGLAVDPAGAVLVADTLNDRVERIAKGRQPAAFWGAPLSAPGSLFRPHDVAINARGDVYVADQLNNRVQEFDRSGRFVRTWGTTGADDGQFTQPTGLGLDSAGNVYVADSANHRIEKFSSSGAYITQFHVSGPAGIDGRPSDVVIDRAGNMYVTDFSNSDILKLSPQGHVLGRWGQLGSPFERLNRPAGITIGSNGYLYVADEQNNRVVVLSITGRVIRSYGGSLTGKRQLRIPASVAVNTHGDVFVGDTLHNRVEEFSPAGRLLRVWTGVSTATGNLNDPQGLAISPSGTLYVADTLNDLVRVISPTSREVREIGIPDYWRLSAPSGMAVDSPGFVYVADTQNNRVIVLSPAGRPVRTLVARGKLKRPHDVAVDAKGHIYVLDAVGGRVYILAPGGRVIRTIPLAPTPASRMKNPQAIALDRHGQIYVADTGNGRVLVFSATGRVIRTLKPIGKPAGVAVDPTGDVFISAIDRGRVEELSPSGILEHTWGTPGHKVGQFSQPTALALTKSGHILVTDTGNNRIVEITP